MVSAAAIHEFGGNFRLKKITDDGLDARLRVSAEDIAAG
jgi:hypothetical protein